MDFFDELHARELLFQCTASEEIQARLLQGPLTLYAGFDPTADGLHVGHLLQVCTLARFQQAGHMPIALVGGATGMVGDPSGKSEERTLLAEEELSNNIESIKKELSQFLDFTDAKNPALLVNNADWTRPVSLLEFLRDIGKHFSINDMMRKESVRSRLEERDQGISFTEFSYMLLQAFDFYTLFSEKNCILQVGGSDQWGNITAGIELIRRKHQKTAYGLTTPLLTTSEGKKFGKTEKGAVWLSPKKTSPYHFYQFWVRTDDRDVIRFLKMASFLPLEEIEQLAKEVKEKPHLREAQKTLAKEMTTLVHGKEECQRVIAASTALFSGSLEEIDERTLLEISEDVPRTTWPKNDFENEGLSLVDLLTGTKLASSRRDARQGLKEGCVYVNNQKQEKEPSSLTKHSLLFEKYLFLRRGRKKYHLVITE